jgi:hypothetical protein
MPNFLKQYPTDPTTNYRVNLDTPLTQAGVYWFEVAGWDKISLHIEIDGTATVQVLKSNKPAPIATTDGIQDGTSEYTQNAWVDIKNTARFIGINVVSISAGSSVNVWVEAV